MVPEMQDHGKWSPKILGLSNGSNLPYACASREVGEIRVINRQIFRHLVPSGRSMIVEDTC